MRKIALLFCVAVLVFSFTGEAWAPTLSATASLGATVGTTFAVSLGIDTGANPGTVATDPTVIQFNTFETYGDGMYMQAPASSTNKSWHYLLVNSNLSSWTASVDVTTLPTGITDKSKFKLGFSGGFDATAPVSTKIITEWPQASFWRAFPNSQITTTFKGSVKNYLMYQFHANVPPGTYSGGVVTYTVTGI